MTTTAPTPWWMPGMMPWIPWAQQTSPEMKQKQKALEDLKAWNMKLNKVINKLMWIKEDIQKDIESLETDKLLQNL